MNRWNCTGILASALGLIATVCSPVHGQVADVPAAAPAAPTKNLWSFFCPTPEQSARCKDKICNSPLGEMLKSAAKPMTLMSGGLLFANCGVPTAADLAKLKAEGKLDSAEGAAAQIKKSEAEARARREAIRYLGTVDCNYWPEAKTALITGLRADPNECVRYEAALALMRGCCCNKLIMTHLKHSANGDDKDGFPAEDSWRVRQAASEALAHCTSVYVEIGDAQEQKKLKEGVPAPQAAAHGKGLLGIFSSASIIPPYPYPQTKNVEPVAKEQTAVYVSVAPQSVQQSEKKRLFGRIEWPTFSSKETSPPEILTTSSESPITPASNRPTVPFSTATSTNNYNVPVNASYRPTDGTTGRSVVTFDNNGAR
jgi:hypothetical protein